MLLRRLQVPKQGYAAQECEDAFAVRRGQRRFALADGATDSVFARQWAELVADLLVELPVLSRAAIAERIPEVQQSWAARVSTGGLDWFTAAKLAQTGALTTFATLRLDVWTRTWRGIAVGDTCVFHVRGDRVLSVLPNLTGREFDNFPDLVASSGAVSDNHRVLGQAAIRRGTYRRGDKFALATDALAAYMLSHLAVGQSGYRAVWNFGRNQAAFSAWVDRHRSSRAICDDDTTLIEIVV